MCCRDGLGLLVADNDLVRPIREFIGLLTWVDGNLNVPKGLLRLYSRNSPHIQGMTLSVGEIPPASALLRRGSVFYLGEAEQNLSALSSYLPAGWVLQ